MQAVHLPAGSHVDLKYISYDIKNQTSGVQEQLFQTQGTGGVSGTVPATLSLSLGLGGGVRPVPPGQDGHIQGHAGGDRDLDGG